MRHEMNIFAQMLENDTGIIEAAECRIEKKIRPSVPAMQLNATAMLRMLAEDTGAMELCDHRNYAATISGRETLFERLSGFVQDMRKERAARNEMHRRIAAACMDARKQAYGD